MKKIFIIVFVFVTLSFVFNSALAHEESGILEGEVIVHVTEEGFDPEDITIQKGTKVIFENLGSKKPWPASNIHPTHRAYPGSDIEFCNAEKVNDIFDSCGGLEQEEIFEFIFNHPGEWRYHDHNNPKLKGSVVVFGEIEGESEEKLKTRSRIWIAIKNFFKRVFLLSESENSLSLLTGAFKEEIEDFNNNYDSSIDKNSEEIFTNKQALFSYVKKYGAGETTKHLHDLEYNRGFGFCHNNAHDVGRFAYALNGGEAFQKCSAECHSGCYHGATEAYFRERGVNNLIEDLSLLCDESLNSFFNHQCIHGIGHGLISWTDYDIHGALESCDLLPEGRASCYSGVFMENIVGGLAAEQGHFTEYLNEDPHMPCNVIDEKYVEACYYYQSSRMVQLFGGDFSKVTEACLEIEEKYQGSCFASMGRDVGGANPTNNKNAIKECGYVPKGKMRLACLSGAVQNTFWVSQGQDNALDFCSLLEDVDEKNNCYSTIFSRATQVVDKKDFKKFCSKVEEKDYANLCLEYYN